MPSIGQGGSTGSNRRFESIDIDEIVERIDENPARWLDNLEVAALATDGDEA